MCIRFVGYNTIIIFRTMTRCRARYKVIEWIMQKNKPKGYSSVSSILLYELFPLSNMSAPMETNCQRK